MSCWNKYRHRKASFVGNKAESEGYWESDANPYQQGSAVKKLVALPVIRRYKETCMAWWLINISQECTLKTAYMWFDWINQISLIETQSYESKRICGVSALRDMRPSVATASHIQKNLKTLMEASFQRISKFSCALTWVTRKIGRHRYEKLS